MAASNPSSLSEELLNALYIKPFTGMIPYLSPNSFLTVSDFDRCSLSKEHWLDLPAEDSHCKGCKKRNPNHVFEAFAYFSDHESGEVREEMLSAISRDFNYYRDVSWLSLQMHKTTLSAWCNKICEPTSPADELAIFALSKLYQHHSVVYTKDKTWSTKGTSAPMSEKEVYQQCDLKFVLMGKGHFVQLIKKPSLNMPVLPLEPLENIYESGYYIDVGTSQQSDNSSALPNPFECAKLSEENKTNDSNERERKYCAVHGCDVTDENECNVPAKTTESLDQYQENVAFPNASKVCETQESSSLQEFNLLNDSEPNLEFDMMDQNSNSNPNLHVKRLQDARTRKKRTRQVKIRNLTKEQIEFIAGPKLLPALTKVEAVIIEHEDPPSKDSDVASVANDAAKTDDTTTNQTPVSSIDCTPDPPMDVLNTSVPNPLTPCNETSKSVMVETPEKSDVPVPKTSRPHRSTAKHINYASMSAANENMESDSDEYSPKSEPMPKLNNKRFPSASRVAAQVHKKTRPDHDEPKQTSTDSTEPKAQPSQVASNDGKNMKGKLDIKTVGLPKRVRAHTFKCQICKFVCHSEKERNTHHKDNHGPLTCAVCGEVYDTPSGLHRHKYRHSDLKFMCITCREQFPFKSQLKDHRTKHLSEKGHSCFAKDCSKSFKNKSSLIRHIKVHAGNIFMCPTNGCSYSNPDERNLKAHMIVHTDTHQYSCTHCGQAFKHHTQMARHVNNKVCASNT